jgi:hypothetical protein
MDLSDIVREGKRIEVARDRIQFWVLILIVLKFEVSAGEVIKLGLILCCCSNKTAYENFTRVDT